MKAIQAIDVQPDQLVVPLQVPRPGLEVGVGEAQVDRDGVGDVETDHADAGQREERRRVPTAPVPLTYSDDAPTMADSTTPSHTEFVGVRVFLLILCQCFEPGSAPSRLNA